MTFERQFWASNNQWATRSEAKEEVFIARLRLSKSWLSFSLLGRVQAKLAALDTAHLSVQIFI